MNNKSTFTKIIDHSVSKEEFSLIYNQKYGFLETTPQPNQEDIVRYYTSDDYISHTDSKRSLFEKIYHWVRSISLKRKLTLINTMSSTSKALLDVGAGTGDFLQKAKENGWTVYGVEPNAEARHIANLKTENCVFDNSELLKFKKHSFDVITLWHVLEHVYDLENQISIYKQLLKDNGKLIVAVPNHKSFDANYYKSYWAAYDVPRHLWHFSQKAIAQLFNANNLEIEKTLPLKFDAYYVSLLSEKYKSGWMNFFNAFFVASRSNLKAASSGEYSSLIYIIKKR